MGAGGQVRGHHRPDRWARPTSSTATDGENIREEDVPAELREAGQGAPRRRSSQRVADVDDELAEKFLDDEPVIDRGAPRRDPPRDPRAQDDPGDVRLGLQEQGRPAPPRRRHPLPARTRREVVNEAHDQNNNEEKVIVSSRTRRSRSSVSRSSCSRTSTASSPTSASTRARSPRATRSSTRATRCEGARPAHVPHALGRSRRDPDGRGGRHRRVLRRRGQLRRDVHRRQGQLHPHVDARAGGRHLARGRPEGPRGGGELLQGAEPLHEGRPDVPRAPGRGVAADDHQRAWASSTSTSTWSA